MLAAGGGVEALGDFQLQGRDHALGRRLRLGQFDQERRGDGVGQIGHELPTAPEPLGLQMLQRVGVEKFQVGGGGQFLRRENRRDAGPSRWPAPGRACSSSNSVSGPSPGPISSTLSRGPNSAAATIRRTWFWSCRKFCPSDLVNFKSRSARTCFISESFTKNSRFKAWTAAASSERVMVSGGVKLMTFPCGALGQHDEAAPQHPFDGPHGQAGGGRTVGVAQFDPGHQAAAADFDLTMPRRDPGAEGLEQEPAGVRRRAAAVGGRGFRRFAPGPWRSPRGCPGRCWYGWPRRWKAARPRPSCPPAPRRRRAGIRRSAPCRGRSSPARCRFPRRRTIFPCGQSRCKSRPR